jgi:membrane-associated protease RseP (regulator of RpoE activity)
MVLHAVDERPIRGASDVRSLFHRALAGDLPRTVTVSIRDGRAFSLDLDQVDLGRWSCAPPAFLATPRVVAADREARLVGWQLVGIGPKSPAGRLGFRNGDIVVGIDGAGVTNAEQVLALTDDINADIGPHQVEVQRRGSPLMVEWWW